MFPLAILLCVSKTNYNFLFYISVFLNDVKDPSSACTKLLLSLVTIVEKESIFHAHSLLDWDVDIIGWFYRNTPFCYIVRDPKAIFNKSHSQT